MSSSMKEVLVVLGNETEQQEIQKFLLDLGVLPTVLGNPIRASELAEQKSFTMALIDADTPVPGAGLELLRALHKISPELPLVFLVNTKSFDVAVAALRAGAKDILIKEPNLTALLGPHVVSVCMERAPQFENPLLEDLWSLNEEFFQRLTKMARQMGELKEQLGRSHSSALHHSEECRILIVEENPWLSEFLLAHLPDGFKAHHVSNGGQALDQSSVQRFHIAFVSDGLTDLPASMVLRTLLAQSPEMIGVLFHAPDQNPGQARVVDGSKMIPILETLTSAEQVVAQLKDLREAQRRRRKERKYLAAFKEEHYDLLRRYADLKQRALRKG